MARVLVVSVVIFSGQLGSGLEGGLGIIRMSTERDLGTLNLQLPVSGPGSEGVKGPLLGIRYGPVIHLENIYPGRTVRRTLITGLNTRNH